MNFDELVSRINYLYKKGQEAGLTPSEKEEQGKLRQMYIDNVKRNFRAQLETIERKPKNKN